MPRGHKGEARTPGSGRKAGSPNKTTKAVKEALERAYEAIGDDDAFANWANDNQTEFYKLWAKMLPQEVNAKLAGAVKVNGRVEFV